MSMVIDGIRNNRSAEGATSHGVPQTGIWILYPWVSAKYPDAPVMELFIIGSWLLAFGVEFVRSRWLRK